MTAQDFDRFGEALVVLAEAFDTTLSSGRIMLYFRGLSDLTWEEINYTFDLALRRCKFFPRVAELREFLHGSARDVEAQAEDAWHQFMAALRGAGTYRSLYCEDHCLAEAIRRVFGDWPAASWLPAPESDQGPMYRVRQREFLAAYQSARRQADWGVTFEQYLRGQIEGHNGSILESWARALSHEPEVTFLPRIGRPHAVLLREVQPQHPLLPVYDRCQIQALIAQVQAPAPQEPDKGA